MVQRLIPKTTIRFLGIQFDGTNYKEIINWCKYCHYQVDELFICLHGKCIKVTKDDWIVNTFDDEFTILTDKEVQAIFKPLGSR